MTEIDERNLVVNQVAAQFGIRPAAIMSRDRHWPIAEARQMAMAIVNLRGMSSVQTGRLFKRNHAAVLHAKSVLRKRLSWCRKTRRMWQAVRHLAVPRLFSEPSDYQI